ncbi:hypothetical protein IJI18_01480, partial [Candidatus Saccharibacteria bacterium]|nr:hypothetical protein [Candidatus Saccharibacteria bacterium]
MVIHHKFKHYIINLKSVRAIGVSGSIILVVLTFLSLFPIIGYQEQAEATPITSTSTITITSASSIASVDIAPNSAT